MYRLGLTKAAIWCGTASCSKSDDEDTMIMLSHFEEAFGLNAMYRVSVWRICPAEQSFLGQVITQCI